MCVSHAQYQYIWMTLYQRLLYRFFSPHLYFLSIVGDDLVFSLEGSHPSSLLSVSQTSLVFFITHLLGKKLIHTKCQSCLKVFCRCSRKYQGHDRGQTLPVGEGLYNVLTHHGKLLPVTFVMSLVVMFQMSFLKRNCCQTQVCVPLAQQDQRNQNVGVWSRERFVVRAKARRTGISGSENLNSLRGFQGRVFKSNIWNEGYGVDDFLLISWWSGNRLLLRESQSSVSWF